jgi:protein CpxP
VKVRVDPDLHRNQLNAGPAMPVNRSILLVLPLLAAAPALAQTTVTGRPAAGGASSATSGGQNAVTRPNTDHPHDSKAAATGTGANAKLERGANSFTEGEARQRLERAGYHEVKDLKKDGDGIWHASAMLDGKPASVGLDFKGNVAVQ